MTLPRMAMRLVRVGSEATSPYQPHHYVVGCVLGVIGMWDRDGQPTSAGVPVLRSWAMVPITMPQRSA